MIHLMTKLFDLVGNSSRQDKLQSPEYQQRLTEILMFSVGYLIAGLDVRGDSLVQQYAGISLTTLPALSCLNNLLVLFYDVECRQKLSMLQCIILPLSRACPLAAL